MPDIRILTTTLACLLLASNSLQAGKIKCWTNSDGVRECGNIVPPEYAQQGHDVISSQGITIDKVERAKTPEELAEEKRLADIKAEEERLRKEQENRDRILLHTFSSEDEIDMALNGKIAALSTEIRLTKKSLANTEERLAGMSKKAANLERAGKPVPKKLATDIAAARQQADEYKVFIATKEKEVAHINEQFSADKERYLLLKSGKVPLPRAQTTTPAGAQKKNPKKTSAKKGG